MNVFWNDLEKFVPMMNATWDKLLAAVQADEPHRPNIESNVRR
jgi:hypothetical protein